MYGSFKKLMDLNIECPVCEEHLCVNYGKNDQKITCPSCSRSFDIASAIQVDVAPTSPATETPAKVARFRMDQNVPPAKSSLAKPKPPKPAKARQADGKDGSEVEGKSNAKAKTEDGFPKINPKLKSKKRSAQKAAAKKAVAKKAVKRNSSASPDEQETPQKAGIEKPAVVPPVSVIKTKEELSGVESIRRDYELRMKRKFITTIVTACVFLLIIGALVTMLILQIRSVNQVAEIPGPDPVAETSNDALEEKADSADEASSPDKPKDETKTDSDNSVQAKPPKDEPVRKLQFKDLPPQKFAYLKKAQVEDAWTTIQPQLVNLKVYDARGSHMAVGTIVDTRGWVLTSYSAVVGASKIEVMQSVRSIDELTDDVLTDQVRGVVAIDQSNDFILLSINRRFVISFSEVEYANSSKVVESAYFVQSAPPTFTNPYAKHEARISVRGELDDLDQNAQDKAIKSKLGEPSGLLGSKDEPKTDDDPLTWLVASSPKQPLPGTPLVTVRGRMAAMNVFSDSRSGQYVLVDDVPDLIASADGKIQPLSVLGGATSEAVLIAVADDHALREQSVGINQTGEACKAFNWIPETEEQYKTFQQFAVYFYELKEYSRENADSDDQNDQAIVKQVTAWENSLTERFVEIIQGSNDEERKKLQNLNQKFARPAIQKGGQVVVLFGQVDPVGIRGDRIILNLYGDDTSVSVPLGERDFPMRPETEWLAFVKAPARPKQVVFKVNDLAIPSFTTFELLCFGFTN